jgi:MoxR-like ATPase
MDPAGTDRRLTDTEVEAAGVLATRVAANVALAAEVRSDVLEHLIVAVLAEGHALIEDLPGVGKTTLARALARSLDLEFARIQCTADLLPADVVGTNVFNQRESRFEFRPGPIFANVVLVDEINRASPKTQSGLLECMQERRVTVDVHTHELARPFLVLATQNPIEYEGTYPLPEAQLDRFLLRVSFGYPSRSDEWEVLSRRMERREDDVELTPIVDGQTLLALQAAIEDVHVSDAVGAYIVDLVTATRTSTSTTVGASPRGSLAVLKVARCKAALAGRDFVTPEDVKAVAVPALAHRLMLKPELWVQQLAAEDIVRELLETVPTPTAEAAAPAPE